MCREESKEEKGNWTFEALILAAELWKGCTLFRHANE
jgi:hypothetical protein